MLNIYSPNITPRLQWISEFIFKAFLGIPVAVVSSYEEPKEVHLNYSNEDIEGVPTIIPQGLLDDNVIKEIVIDDYDPSTKSFFQTKDSFLGFDFLAAAFYLVSRYEEYLPHEKDKHGRYMFKNSLAAKNNFIEYPLVDIWALAAKKKLQSHFPELKFTERKFAFIPTMDVDVAFEFKGRSAFRHLRSTAKDVVQLNAKRIEKRIKVLGSTKDDFDTYEYFDHLLAKYNLNGRYFFLLGDYGEFDKNLSHENEHLRHIIKERANIAGSHPSYKSHDVEGQLAIEKDRLSNIIEREVEDSRFHYLKFEFPKSFRKLINAGYKRDYSMVYPEVPGFRAGTCTPFYFYDLDKETATGLKIYPTAIMDATCQDYLKLSQHQTEEKMLSLIEHVKAVEGNFICLWHNDTLSDSGKWKGWQSVLENTLKKVFPAQGDTE